ncbi:RBBP9/YdeN family alpha/beta hydrolase [Microbacterium gilvum]|uniref:Alpha/beta hydrolase n=1 Tax=Microbacterium gilvum TaxID=1336204 RepID=A0ABP8ZVQ9_9MICO
MPITRVVVAHGYGAQPADHWFPWLAEALTEEGVSVIVPRLPDSDAPRPDRWTGDLVEVIGVPDANTAVVAHSLGTASTLHALDRVPGEWVLGAFVSVAGFVSALPALPQLDSFTAIRPDVARTASRTAVRAVVQSDADSYVPASHTRELSDLLRAETFTLAGAGHFLGEDDVRALPIVLDRLQDA